MASFHRVLLALAAVVATLFTATVAKVNCPRNYIEPGEKSGHCYRLFPSTKHWDQAAEICSADDGWLATIRDSTQNSHIVKMYRALRGSQCSDRFFVGANDIDSEGVFEWVEDGSRATWLHFQNDQPDNWGNEDCVEVDMWDYKWNDRPTHGHELCFICEKRPI